MATSNKSKKILEKARKIAAKTKKKKVSKVDVKKKTTSYPEGQNAPQSKKYTQESDKTLSAKATGWRWTKEGAKKLGKNVESKPTTSDIEKYRNETFKLKGKPNKSGPKGVGDGSHRYLYVERRADKADITRKNKLEDGGEMAKGGKLPRINDVREDGKLIDSQMIDEGYVSNAGEQEFYEYKGKKYVITTWNDNAEEHKDGEEEIQIWNHEMARGGKIPSSEVADFKKYVKSNYGKDEIWSEFFPPVGVSNEEINHAVSQYIDYCKTKDDQWGGGDTFDREIVRDIMLYNRGTKKGLEYQRAIKEIFGKDKKEYGGILQPMIGGVNADPRFDIYNTTMFAEKGAELAKGGKTKKAKVEKVDNSSLVRYAQTNDQVKVLTDIIPTLNKKGIKLTYGTSIGKSPQTIIFDKDYHDGILYISPDGWYGTNTYHDEEFSDADDLEYVIDNPSDDDEYANGGNLKVVPIYLYEVTYSKHGKKGTFVSKVKAKSEEDAINKWIDETNRTEGVYTIIDVVKSSRTRMEDGGEMAHGGTTHEQGYDDREDESLAMRHGKIASKDFVGSHARREHSRRDDAHFETRHKKAYGGLTDASIELLD